MSLADKMLIPKKLTRCSAIAERPRCRVRYSFRQKVEDWNWETIFYGHYRSIFSHSDIIGRKIWRIWWKKRKIRAITAFKVIEVGTNRKPVCDFLLVINSNWHPISYRFGVIASYCSNFAPTRSLWLKISGRRGYPPPIIFARLVRPMNALQLYPWQFSHICYGWGATSENRSNKMLSYRRETALQGAL